MGSLSANAERFQQWRTIDSVQLDPQGEFNELETLVRGALAPKYLLDYLRYFVLFEDDGQPGRAARPCQKTRSSSTTRSPTTSRPSKS